MTERKLSPDEEIVLEEFVERECLPDQSFSSVPIENKVNRIDIEIAGWTAVGERVVERIRSLEKLRKEKLEEWRENEAERV